VRIQATAEGAVVDQMRNLIGRGHVDQLVVELPVTPDVLGQIVDAGRFAGRPVRLVGELSRADLPSTLPGEHWVKPATGHQGSWLLTLPRPPAWKLAVKRSLDVALASVLLAATSPILLAVAIGVRLSSPGAVFYRWRVVGRNGRPFTAYKFRTMVENADALKQNLIPLNEMRGPVFKLTDDPRLTGVGRWLRKHSIDELPQLWSVLKGDMSLVGPRPPLHDEYPEFELWQMRKLSVTPGLTCLWQVSGRNRISDFAEWARLDLKYIDNCSNHRRRDQGDRSLNTEKP
jgi:lipopolysaccharide/colanic/teichoic acid biosynthesis glycosyltransferase